MIQPLTALKESIRALLDGRGIGGLFSQTVAQKMRLGSRLQTMAHRGVVRIVTADAELDETAGVILADCTAGDVQITCPLSSLVEGWEWTIKKTDATANKVILMPVEDETVDGYTSAQTPSQAGTAWATQHSTRTVRPEAGTGWWIL